MQDRAGAVWLVADFFTHCHRISGRVNVRNKKLADQLNDSNTDYLDIEDAYISNTERPADITASHLTSVLRKSNVTAAVVARTEDGMPRDHMYGSYFGTVLRKVFIAVPSFEIEGNLRLSGSLDMRALLTTGTEDFISILDGHMRNASKPDIAFSGGAILVNKNQIEAFFVTEVEEDIEE
jgi:hypothetical protein